MYTFLTLVHILFAIEANQDIPKGLLVGLCGVESSYKVNAINLDDGGSPSVGLCQIKFTTAQFLGYKGTPERLWKDPTVNAEWAGRYLKWQLRRYSGDILKGTSAYNAGTYSTKNKAYVRKVMKNYAKFKALR